jgi:arylsulfatase A-like enzyme
VPFIIYNPYSKNKGIRVSEPVTILDVAPTILKLMGWKKPKEMEGRNILNLKELKTTPEIYAETYTPESFYNRFSIIKNQWHLIFTPKKKKFELFNLVKDTSESRDIYSKYKEKEEIKELERKLREYAEKALANRTIRTPDKETLKMLKSLGYLK